MAGLTARDAVILGHKTLELLERLVGLFLRDNSTNYEASISLHLIQDFVVFRIEYLFEVENRNRCCTLFDNSRHRGVYSFKRLDLSLIQALSLYSAMIFFFRSC